MKKKSNTLQKYVRLLSFENALKVIDFININKDDYANITVGGISIQISEERFDGLKLFLESLRVRFEITDIPPYQVEKQIVNNLKSCGVIK